MSEFLPKRNRANSPFDVRNRAKEREFARFLATSEREFARIRENRAKTREFARKMLHFRHCINKIKNIRIEI